MQVPDPQIVFVGNILVCHCKPEWGKHRCNRWNEKLSLSIWPVPQSHVQLWKVHLFFILWNLRLHQEIIKLQKYVDIFLCCCFKTWQISQNLVHLWTWINFNYMVLETFTAKMILINHITLNVCMKALFYLQFTKDTKFALFVPSGNCKWQSQPRKTLILFFIFSFSILWQFVFDKDTPQWI